jgi:hypothetical protein
MGKSSNELLNLRIYSQPSEEFSAEVEKVLQIRCREIDEDTLSDISKKLYSIAEKDIKEKLLTPVVAPEAYAEKACLYYCYDCKYNGHCDAGHHCFFVNTLRDFMVGKIERLPDYTSGDRGSRQRADGK